MRGLFGRLAGVAAVKALAAELNIDAAMLENRWRRQASLLVEKGESVAAAESFALATITTTARHDARTASELSLGAGRKSRR